MGIKVQLNAHAGLAVIAAAIACEPALAQTSGDASSDEIVVTARKRDETSIAVPVVLTAVSNEMLERRAIIRLDDLQTLVPQLQIGNGGSNSTGGVLAIRGIAGSENNPFADQAVSFNVDGVQVSKVLIRRMAEMDLAQIEVLKGPQALFFGKNSPAGIISMRSADPTKVFEAKASVGYEFNAREWRGDAFVSGPISDTLGARLAVLGTTQRGWFRNEVDDSSFLTFTRSAPDHTPKTKEYALRGTLKWEPSDRFNVRFKVAWQEIDDSMPQHGQERLFCPFGVPQLGVGTIGTPGYDGGLDDCELNGRSATFQSGPYLATLNDRWHADGNDFLHMKQALISNEMNYDLTDDLMLTSLTGYYYITQRLSATFPAWNPLTNLVTANEYESKEFSQEVRLASDFDFPINFLVGGYYQRTKTFSGNTTFNGHIPNAAGVPPTQLNNYLTFQNGQAYSGFAQLTYKPVEQIELTAGGRYSYEKKRLPRIETSPTGIAPIPRTVVPVNPLIPREESWNDFSPEFSISYRPNSDLTVFANYKQGFLSGGFNGGAGNLAADLRFDQQKIKGFEGGVKARLLDGALRVNLAAYRYVITGMQINTSIILPNGVPQQIVLNAGKVTVKGIEGDFNYRTPLDGLSLHGGAGYNNARYDVFSGSCYRGQTHETGCNFGAPTTTIIGGQPFITYALQDQAGQQIYRAPKWSGGVGFLYETDIGSGLRFGLNGDMNFSSSYWTTVTAHPHARQKAYQLFDAAARIGAQNDSWEVALIGKNLTQKYFTQRVGDSTGGTPGGRAANDPRGNFFADLNGFPNRGREIWLRLTVRYGGS